jgi:hypothetical protein
MALSQNNNHTFVSGELVTSAKLNSTKHIQTDTEAVNDLFTGNPGQLTYDSTNKKLRLHDGTTAGGLEVTPAQSSVSLGAGSVTENMLATGAVTDTKLATDSVTEEKISDGAVTASKLASDAISLGAGSVTSEMLATGAIASIDDIGDVKTTGTSGGVNHVPSDGDSLVWNASHNHWMPGSGLQGGNLGARAILHATRQPLNGAYFSTRSWSLGSRSQGVASVTWPPGSGSATYKDGLRFTLNFDLTDPIVLLPNIVGYLAVTVNGRVIDIMARDPEHYNFSNVEVPWGQNICLGIVF